MQLLDVLALDCWPSKFKYRVLSISSRSTYFTTFRIDVSKDPVSPDLRWVAALQLEPKGRLPLSKLEEFFEDLRRSRSRTVSLGFLQASPSLSPSRAAHFDQVTAHPLPYLWALIDMPSPPPPPVSNTDHLLEEAAHPTKSCPSYSMLPSPFPSLAACFDQVTARAPVSWVVSLITYCHQDMSAQISGAFTRYLQGHVGLALYRSIKGGQAWLASLQAGKPLH